MAEQLNQTIEQQAPQIEASQSAFANVLQEQGLVSPELVDSGMIDMFARDDSVGMDTLEHILVGDEQGGGHHLRTMNDLGLEDRTVMSEINPGGDPERPIHKKLVREQSIRPNSAFRSRIVEIGDKQKVGGSAMFPNEWSTEDVINSIAAVALTPPAKHDLERLSFIHQGEVNGVRIQVVTSEATGKIITAAPKVSTK